MQAISIQRALTFGCVGVRRWLGRRSCDQHSPNVFTRNIFSSNDAGMVHILQLVLTGQDLGLDNLLDCRFFLCDIHLARGRGRDKPTGRSAILFGANPLGEREREVGGTCGDTHLHDVPDGIALAARALSSLSAGGER